MSFRMRAFIATLALCLLPHVAAAQPGDLAAQEAQAMKQEPSGQAEALQKAPVGVFDLVYDEQGQLLRLKIKEVAPVSTALPGIQGERQAQKRASLAARAAFSKFLSEQVTVQESDSEQFVIRAKDGKESAEVLTQTSRMITSMSDSFMRGLIPLYERVEGEGNERVFTVVLGWSKKLVMASAQAEQTMKDSRNPEGNTRTATPGTQERQGGNADTKEWTVKDTNNF